MRSAIEILEEASASRKGGLRVHAAPPLLSTLLNAIRKERRRNPAFHHLVFKWRKSHIDILNGNNILDSIEEIFQ